MWPQGLRASVYNQLLFNRTKNLNSKTVFLSSSGRLKLSTEENTKILEIVNNKPTEELNRYDISKVRAKKIEEWKTQNGSFQSIDQILQISGFGQKVLDKFCQSIIEGRSTEVKKPAKARSGQFTTPVVPEAHINTYKSCLSLQIGVSSITWVRFEVPRISPCLVTHWEHHDIVEKRLTLTDLVQRCIYLDTLIPEADCYVIETPQTAKPGTPGNAEQVNINAQKAQLTAVLSFALAKRKQEINKENDVLCPRLFLLKRFIAPKLFGTLVGSERISAEEVILSLMRTHINFEDTDDVTLEQNTTNLHAGEITVPLTLRESYKSCERYQRELLGQSLLLGLAFIRLCLLHCPKSLSVFLSPQKLA